MRTFATLFAVVAWLLSGAAAAELQPAKGRLLVASELGHGELFGETVILLLHYDEHGAMGLVVNRPTEIEVSELLTDAAIVSGYSGVIHWGGPVQMQSVTALLRTDAPPEGANAVIDSVYVVPIEEGLTDGAADSAGLRFYIGYAGWAPGQLDQELARGSWHVVPASDEHVFADDPKALWRRLRLPPEQRAALSKLDLVHIM